MGQHGHFLCARDRVQPLILEQLENLERHMTNRNAHATFGTHLERVRARMCQAIHRA